MKKIKIINSDVLKIFAMMLMLTDHLWATVVEGNQWMTNIGRMAFPIFAFLIAEGFVHTSNFKKYALRLLAFGVISEIPFNLIYSGSPIFPFHQNVMFTLLLGLLSIRAIDRFKQNKSVKSGIRCLLCVAGCLLLGTVGMVDYGAMGITTVIVFYVFRDFKLAPLGQLISLVLLYIVFFKGQSVVIDLFGYEYFLPLQGFGVLALIPIWLYNGKRASKSKALKYAFYAFYPAHMLIIYAVYRLAF